MNSCIVCDNSSFSEIYNYTLLKCRECGFVTANMSISLEELSRIYSENYFKGEEYTDYIRDKKILQQNFNNRLSFILSNIGFHRIVNALEIGSAYGFFAEVFCNRFKKTEFVGIDVAQEAILYGIE